METTAPAGAAGPPAYRLDQRERRAFAADGAALADGFTGAAGRARTDPAGVPPGLAGFLHDLTVRTPDCGAALVRGIEIGDLPPTPQQRTAGTLARHPTTGNLLMIADTLGSLTGYADEKDGALVHDVHAVRGEERRIENTGSGDFGFHTENVHHPHRPDFLGLLCLRQDHDGTGAARLSSVRETVRDLPAGAAAVLRRARFRSLFPTSFCTGPDVGGQPSSEPHPVISGDPDAPVMRFNAHNTYALDEDGAAALEQFGAALERHARSILLEPGDLLIIDNHVAAHGRSAFRPRYDGHDRWLRRFYSLRTAPAAERARPRVLPALVG
jgi:L-asparagine oxygenase